MDISLQVLFFIALLILVAKGLGGLSARVRLPVVLGELLAGVILGPTILNIWRFAWFSPPAQVVGDGPASLAAIFKVPAQLGVGVVMFLAGVGGRGGLVESWVGPAFCGGCGGGLP